MTHDVASATNTLMGRPSGTVAFLFSDLQGSTELLRTLGDDYTRLIAEQGRVVGDACIAEGGRVVDSQGDSFFVVFPRVREAAAAAANAQRKLAEHPWPGEARVRVRMGVHAGEPLVSRSEERR